MDFVDLQREDGFTQGILSGDLVKLEAAAYVQIQKKFKGRLPLTLRPAHAERRAGFENYSKQMLVFLSKTTPH